MLLGMTSRNRALVLAAGIAILASLSTTGLPAASAASLAGVPLWQVIPTPNAGTSRNVLRDVAPLSSDDAWAVGSFFDAEAQAEPVPD